MVPWAEPHARFTRLVERLAIDVLRACRVTGATQIRGRSWDEAWPLMERAVTRGQARQAQRIVRPLGVDEKAAATGHRARALVTDLEAGTVEYVGEDRTQMSLEAHDPRLSGAQRVGIEAVAMDMWEPDIKLQTLKTWAYGFRTIDHVKTVIYFPCGGLALYPC